MLGVRRLIGFGLLLGAVYLAVGSYFVGPYSDNTDPCITGRRYWIVSETK